MNSLAPQFAGNFSPKEHNELSSDLRDGKNASAPVLPRAAFSIRGILSGAKESKNLP